MKWTIAALILVGLIAAAAAAVLAVTLKTDFGRGGESVSQQMEVIVATRPLSKMTMVDSTCLAKVTMSKGEAPEKAITNSAQIIGRALLVPVLEGQAFTSTQFASSDSGIQLATIIPEGSRAMSVMLTDETGIEDLLYPGSIVDVVASFRLPAIAGGNSAEVVSVTLLQGLQVLSVGGRSIVGDGGTQLEPDPSGRRSRMITLMVNTAQAEALQLAASHGEVSVSLRNPLDTQMIEVDGTRISELSKDLADRIRRLAQNEIGAGPLVVPELLNPASAGNGAAGSSPVANGSPSTTNASASATAPRQPLTWQTLILRGSSREIQKFEIQPEQEPQ
jgi:pilus assembly protein CpaB